MPQVVSPPTRHWGVPGSRTALLPLWYLLVTIVLARNPFPLCCRGWVVLEALGPSRAWFAFQAA